LADLARKVSNGHCDVERHRVLIPAQIVGDDRLEHFFERDVREGSVIRVAPDGVRTWRNHSQEDLYYIVIQAMAASMSATAIEDGVMYQGMVMWPE
jgi:hypothetical protein